MANKLSNDFVKGLLKDKLQIIQSKEYTANEVKSMVNLIYRESRLLATDIKTYTKDIPELSFNTEMLVGIIEDFYYTKFASDLITMYNDKNNAKNEKFSSKLKTIETYTVDELMELLEIKTEFRLANMKQPTIVPYKSAILELNKIKNMINPNEILVTLIGIHNQDSCQNKNGGACISQR